MRIVAGSARGRRLTTPTGLEVRPTTDRVREAVFNALGSLDALDGAAVIDLFAGSGALGIEALSRGASHVTVVDSSPKALAAVRSNLATCGFEGAATVVRADAAAHLAHSTEQFDLALLDPPYGFDAWDDLLATLRADTLVIESDRTVDTGVDNEVLRERRYGGTVVTIARSIGRGRHDRETSEDRT
ncbi:16S rRNA (guanine(966)-N(2))-methyltransferase RsmD [soil metagenome]